MPPFFNSVVLLSLVIVLSTPRLSNCQNVSKTTNKTIVNIGILLDFPPDPVGYVPAVKLAKSVIENSTEFKYLTDRYDLNMIIKYDWVGIIVNIIHKIDNVHSNSFSFSFKSFTCGNIICRQMRRWQ